MINNTLQQLKAATDALRKRMGNKLPTQTWRDIQREAHDRAFVVAGAAKADLLSDLAKAVDDSMTKGLGLDYFRKQFTDIVAKYGWSHAGGRNWRSRVIYQTNLQVSYAAGRLRQLRDPDLRKLRPFWKYVHSDSVLNPRPLHVRWDGLVLEADHEWFKTHYPPNGWGCQCRIVAVSKREADKATKRTPPDDGSREVGGRLVPNGIDEGWDYMPGDRARDELAEFTQAKDARLPNLLGAQMSVRNRAGFESSGDEEVDSVFNDVLNVVKGAHRLPELPTIRLQKMPPIDPQAKHVRLGEYDHVQKQLNIQTQSPVPVRFVIAHELGHVLDYNAFGGGRGVWPDALKFVGRAIENSAQFEKLQKSNNAYYAYLRQPNELWARAYSQWLSGKDSKLKLGLDFLRNSDLEDDKLMQWSDEDFKPISAAIERMLRLRGWLYD